MGFLVLHPCSTHISKASLGTSSGSSLNSWRVSCLPSSQYFPVWKAGKVSAKSGEKQECPLKLLGQCPCSVCVQLQQGLPSWMSEHRTSVAHADPGSLAGCPEVTHARFFIVSGQARHGMGSKRGAFVQSTMPWGCGAGKSCCSGRHY